MLSANVKNMASSRSTKIELKTEYFTVMIPEEKAKELLLKFSKHVDVINNTGAVGHKLWDKRTKTCALIAVDEIISDYSSHRIKYWVTLQHALEIREYWDDVKSYLNAL